MCSEVCVCVCVCVMPSATYKSRDLHLFSDSQCNQTCVLLSAPRSFDFQQSVI